MIALAWPLVFLATVVIGAVLFERHATRTRASTSDALEILSNNVIAARVELDALHKRLDTLERLVSDPTQGLAEQVRQVKNSNRFGK